MHYKNGREAKNGDPVIMVTTLGSQKIAVGGILYGATPGNNTCNGTLAPLNGGTSHYANLSECLHVDDLAAAMETIPDSTIVPVVPAVTPAEGEAAKV